MIIKSLSRKRASYDQLLAYIDTKAQPNFTIEHNVPYGVDMDVLCQYFENLVGHLPPRKNGNQLYHEIISLKISKNRSLEAYQRGLYTICQSYIQARASDHAVYGKLHMEKHHLHVHLVMSPNTIGTPDKRVRFAKKEFSELQQQLENWVLQTFPELGQQQVYTQDHPQRQMSDKEVQRSKRTQKSTQKEQLRLMLEHLLTQAESQQDFARLLQRHGLELYYRGSVAGIKTDKRQYRLSTLGLDVAFQALSKQASPAQAREQPETQPIHESDPSILRDQAHKTTIEAERVWALLHDIFTYSSSREALVQGLDSYGVALQERVDGIWCVKENFEAPLATMGLLPAYEAAKVRLAPKYAEQEPVHHQEAPQVSERLQRLREIRQNQQHEIELDGPEWG
jgi:hypothetical protein